MVKMLFKLLNLLTHPYFYFLVLLKHLPIRNQQAVSSILTAGSSKYNGLAINWLTHILLLLTYC